MFVAKCSIVTVEPHLLLNICLTQYGRLALSRHTCFYVAVLSIVSVEADFVSCTFFIESHATVEAHCSQICLKECGHL